MWQELSVSPSGRCSRSSTTWWSEGYLVKVKMGRRNRYTVVRGAHLRHQQVSRVTLGEFLDLLVPAAPAPSQRPSKE